MSDFFSGLSDPTTVQLDSVDGGFYDSGSWSSNAADTNFSTGGSMPSLLDTPPVIMPDPAFAAVPSIISDTPVLPAPGGMTAYDVWGDTSGGPANTTDPLEAPSGPSSVARSIVTGGAHTGAFWSAIGAGGASAAKVLSQGMVPIPSNPRGVQTTGLYTPLGVPSQTLRPSLGAQAGSLSAGVTSTGVLMLIAVGILLIWIAKR